MNSSEFFESWDIEQQIPAPEPQQEPLVEEDSSPIIPQPNTFLETSPKKTMDIASVQTPFPISPQQEDLLRQAMYDASTSGATDSSMICCGSNCPYAKSCWFTKLKIPYPINESCPIETALMKTWAKAFAQELEIDENDPMTFYDATLAQSMAGLRLLVHRAMWGMADNPVLEQIFVNQTNSGNVTTVFGNLNADYLLKAIERLQKLGNDALLSRRQKATLLKGGYKDKSKQTADLQDRIRKHIIETRKTIKLDPDGVPTELTEIHTYIPKPKVE